MIDPTDLMKNATVKLEPAILINEMDIGLSKINSEAVTSKKSNPKKMNSNLSHTLTMAMANLPDISSEENNDNESSLAECLSKNGDLSKISHTS